MQNLLLDRRAWTGWEVEAEYSSETAHSKRKMQIKSPKSQRKKLLKSAHLLN